MILTMFFSVCYSLSTIPLLLERQKQYTHCGFSLPKRLALSIIAALAILPGIYFAVKLSSGVTNGVVSNTPSYWKGTLPLIGLLVITIFLILSTTPKALRTYLQKKWISLRLTRFLYGFISIIFITYLSLSILPLIFSNESLFTFIEVVSERLGVFPLIGLFLLTIFLFATLSVIAFDYLRIPIFSLILLLMFIPSVTGLSSFNNARLLSEGDGEFAPKPIDDAFITWLKKRKDYTQHSTNQTAKPYPVYLVSMAGGGAYAAYHSSYFLTRLFESCPKLRHHIFAISGVSGGSLGAALITSQANLGSKHDDQQQVDEDLLCDIDPSLVDESPRVKNIEEFFSIDHVSVLIWARLYPDMLRRLLWYNKSELASDTIFEEWLSTVWSIVSAESGTTNLSESVLSYWKSDGDAPAVFFNITNTQTGRAETISPLKYPQNLATRKNVDMRIITGASMSFRFPLLNSPGTLPRGGYNGNGPALITALDNLDTTATYVDGGYYDNSGVHVLNQVADEIKGIAERENLMIDLRFITFTSSPNQDIFQTATKKNDALLGSINALFSARFQRGLDEWVDVVADHKKFDVHFSLRPSNFYYLTPLGWTLSKNTRDVIKLHYGVPSDCDYVEKNWPDIVFTKELLRSRFPVDQYKGIPEFSNDIIDQKSQTNFLNVRKSTFPQNFIDLNLLSQRIYMGCQIKNIFKDLKD